MELWQEAFKAVEDIHNLMGISKKALQPKMMAQYYLKLALVFWKSGNQLYHAAAVSWNFKFRGGNLHFCFWIMKVCPYLSLVISNLLLRNTGLDFGTLFNTFFSYFEGPLNLDLHNSFFFCHI